MTRIQALLKGRLFSWRGLVVIFILSFFYFLIGITQILDVYDEGIPVYGAERVLNGEVPYRDFWTIYAPGQFYVLAGLFKVFGSSLLVERLYDTAARALLSTLFFLIVSRLAPRVWCWAIWFLVTLWLKFFGYYASSTFPALFFALASLLSFSNAWGGGKSGRQLFISGVLAGLAAVFRHDFGFYTVLAEILAAIFFVIRQAQPKEEGEVSSGGPLKSIALLGPYLLGLALIAVPFSVYFLSRVPLGELVYDLVTFPVKIFPAVRDLPYPAPIPHPSRFFQGELSFFQYLAEISRRWGFYLPPLCFLAVFFFLVFSGKKRKARPNENGDLDAVWRWRMVLFLIFGVLAFNNVRVRSDLPHLLPSFAAAGLLFTALVPKMLEQKLLRRKAVLGFVWVGALALLIYPVYELQKPGIDKRFRPLLYAHDLERAGPVGVNPYQADAIHYIQNAAYPWEKIFVGNNRHDLIYNNDVMFYFLSERHCATRYHELSPGSATSFAAQSKMVEDLERNNVRYIVLLSRFQNPGVTNEPAPVRMLDEFIAENYQPTHKFGDWSVWERK